LTSTNFCSCAVTPGTSAPPNCTLQASANMLDTCSSVVDLAPAVAWFVRAGLQLAAAAGCGCQIRGSVP
jgi:hypothetical protein